MPDGRRHKQNAAKRVRPAGRKPLKAAARHPGDSLVDEKRAAAPGVLGVAQGGPQGLARSLRENGSGTR